MICGLVSAFGWTPTEIIKMDIELLLPFIGYYPWWKEQEKKQANVEYKYADQVDWWF